MSCTFVDIALFSALHLVVLTVYASTLAIRLAPNVCSPTEFAFNRSRGTICCEWLSRDLFSTDGGLYKDSQRI
jgi:hypothetical protein